MTTTTDETQTDLDAFAAEARAWLAGRLPPRASADRTATHDLDVFHDLPREDEVRLLDRARAWVRELYDAGYAAIALDPELGGAGHSIAHAQAFAGELAAFEPPPSTELISVTTRLVAPTVARFGSTELRDQFLTAFHRTDLLACQLFSEPGAGSDLAAVATRAERDGDAWRIRGQKIWSSGAQFADWGLLLGRTDPAVVKHAGLTMFLVPMDAEGVDVRPIRQMSGGSSFNEVFLDDVRVHDRLRVGEIGEGWRVANATLGMERTASGSGQRRKGGDLDDLVDLARRRGRIEDPLVRQELADLYVRVALRHATTDRVARSQARGETSDAAGSIGKIVASDTLMRIGEAAVRILGPGMIADQGEPGTFAWTRHLLGAPGYRLAGGTDEVQRNLIGERVLGLPREPRVDRDVAFADLARG